MEVCGERRRTDYRAEVSLVETADVPRRKEPVDRKSRCSLNRSNRGDNYVPY